MFRWFYQPLSEERVSLHSGLYTTGVRDVHNEGTTAMRKHYYSIIMGKLTNFWSKSACAPGDLRTLMDPRKPSRFRKNLKKITEFCRFWQFLSRYRNRTNHLSLLCKSACKRKLLFSVISNNYIFLV